VASTIELQCWAQADDCAYTVWNNCNILGQLNFEQASNLWGQVLLKVGIPVQAIRPKGE
jgi:hypothetical protein